MPAKRTKTKPSITIVGPGNLGSALALELVRIGYPIRQMVSRRESRSAKDARALARRLKAKHIFLGETALNSDIVWITVPDDGIAEVARQLAASQSWKDTIVLHSSGALTSDELSALKKKGAQVASVHPLMSFVRGRTPTWQEVTFAVEGDAKALRIASDVARELGGRPFKIGKENKALYHAFGAFASPLVIALMSAMEQVGQAAGIPRARIKRTMLPLLRETWTNYLVMDAPRAFSGPLVRGDVHTIRKHLAELKRTPEAREVYLALARAAIERLPVKNKEALRKELRSANESPKGV